MRIPSSIIRILPLSYSSIAVVSATLLPTNASPVITSGTHAHRRDTDVRMTSRIGRAVEVSVPMMIQLKYVGIGRSSTASNEPTTARASRVATMVRSASSGSRWPL